MKKCPAENTYQREKVKLAIDFVPPIYPCEKCGYPVIQGYGCCYCGDSAPYEKEENS